MGGNGRELLVHGQPVRLACRGPAHEAEVAIGLDADQVRGIGDNRGVLRGYAAASFRFKGARQNVEPISTACEALQVEVQFGVAFVVGDRGRQGFVIRLFDHFADLEAIVGEGIEVGKRGGEIEFAFHPAIAGGLSKQMHDRNARLHVSGCEPAGDRFIG